MALLQGDYYPALASFKNAKVKVNFGPKFSFPPKDLKFRPMSDRAEELAVEQAMSDMRFFAENESNLTLDSYQFQSP